ncbi:MAG TPA: flagellar biosynthetic protein FliR [Spirochaetota bacterium]|jgi:flagellar biosynthetic protein FliR|nr:flagellar biosynthetic protein FliR [Spirochaetota bacterium]HQO22209.1 flagellar biosynthetic protein FliR [Spirochaetota bacterium]HQQ22381.1 flagellar biosynthetic protein FliR [Spirochaetota bacterium]
MEYFVNNFQTFLLVMIRMTSMFLIAPFFSSDLIPFRTRALLGFLVSMIIFPMVAKGTYGITSNMGLYSIFVLREIAIGLFIGFLASIIFSAFQLSGQYFAVQIGFGMSEVMDPLAQVSIPIIGQIKNMIGLLVFLYINGHHFMIKAIYRSFEYAPVFPLGEGEFFTKHLIYSFSGMFVVAFKIALPVVATVFLISIAMGVLSKAAPQMNVMMLGFPVKIMVAFAMLALLSPMIIRIMKVSLERTFTFVMGVIQAWPK